LHRFNREFDMKRLAITALAVCSVATACSVREERTVVPAPAPPPPPTVLYTTPPPPPPPPRPDTVSPSRDEYGFRYDAQGNRIDAQGNIISPQSTTP
jgi:hypothetical protein